MVAFCDATNEIIKPGTSYHEIVHPIGPALNLTAREGYLTDGFKDKVRELYGCDKTYEKKVADDEPLPAAPRDWDLIKDHCTQLVAKELICSDDGFVQTRLVMEVYNKPDLTEDDYDTLVSFTVCGLLSEENLKKKKEKFQFYRSDGISFPQW